MAEDGIAAISHRRFRVTTRQREGAISSPHLLGREFVAEYPHQVRVSDITYIWTTEEWLYLGVILDLFSRAVVGWSTSARIDAQLICTAFQRATRRYPLRFPVIIHSDRGSQYTNAMYRELLSNQSVLVFQSNGLSCYDNAIAESFFHTLKTEGVDHAQFPRCADAHGYLFDYIEVSYNQQRLHSSFGHSTPMQTLQGIFNTKAA